jgi:hypothetical protein
MMAEARAGVLGLGAVVAICLLSTSGCEDEGESQTLGCQDGGVAYCATTDGRESIERCVLDPDGPNFIEFQELCEEGEVCVKPRDPSQEAERDAICVPGSGGTGGSGGAGGNGGGTGSCAEIDIPGEPNLTGPLSVSPAVATFDDFVTVTVGVDGDTQEVTAILRNPSSDIVGGTGFATTAGNETLPIDVLVGTVADPGPQVVDLELRADASNRIDYVLYTSGEGDNYVRINVENDIPGPETETTCLELTCDIQF